MNEQAIAANVAALKNAIEANEEAAGLAACMALLTGFLVNVARIAEATDALAKAPAASARLRPTRL